MRCPECDSVRVIVKDVRRQDTKRKNGETIAERLLLKGNVVVRRRQCLSKDCMTEFYTVEKIRDVTIRRH